MLRHRDVVPDRVGLRPFERWDTRDTVGDCREPDWSDIVTSEQTPRGRDFGQASSGFCCVWERFAFLGSCFATPGKMRAGLVPPSGGTRDER
jgi:hypothetical protein